MTSTDNMGFFDRFKSKFEQAIRERRSARPKTEKRGASATKKVEDKVLRSDTAAIQAAGASTPVADRVLIRPLVTEKTATLTAGRKYVFVVRPEATKPEVKKAVQELYGVSPDSVDMINQAGKAVRLGRRNGRRKDWKKAIITMPEGKTLPIYE